MKELAILLGGYIGLGLLVCLVLSFRKSKSPHAVKAIELFDIEASPIGLALGVLLWPLWVFVQIMEQENLAPPRDTPQDNPPEDLERLIGRIGIAVTPMLPSGRLELDGKDYDAVSDGPKLERGEQVMIISVSMRILKVSRHQP